MSPMSAQDRRGARVLGLSVLVVALVAGAIAWQEAATPRLDPVTLQPVGKVPCGEVSILLDATDPASAAELAGVTEWLRQFELRDLTPGVRVTVWVLGTQRSGGLERVFARYYPGRESDPLLHNPAASAARCESLFTRPLREAVIRAASGEHFRVSPDLEAVRELAAQPEFIASAGPRRLILISDLAQHTATLDFYREVPDPTGFLRSTEAQGLRADLRGTTVDVLFLPRGGDASLGARLTGFWRTYLTGCGAGLARVWRV